MASLRSSMTNVNRKSITMRWICRHPLKRSILVTSLLALLFYAVLWTLLVNASTRTFPRAINSSYTQAKKVLLVSEPSCGASLIGDILDLSSRIYYIFEPLTRLSSHEVKMYDWRSRAGNTGSFPDKLYSDSIALLDALLTCGFSRMDLTTLNASALALHPKTATLARCVKAAAEAKGSLNSGNDSVNMIRSFAELSSCVEQAESECFNKTILLKVVGSRLIHLEPLLLRHRDLVVLYLVRDPRAMIWSTWKSTPKPNDISTLALNTCSILEDNLSSALELSRRHEGRIALLKYENMAKAPVKTSQLLFSYLGMNCSNETGHMCQLAILERSTTSLNPTSVLEATATTDLESPELSSLNYDDALENLFQSAYAWREP
ncbi:uncharacterized protein LOC112561860 isoform X2 [Pomacea canaliculata]|nr:uncharacterized protein LOC112561860 isoform X2 [Pomacea canaliculata]XP_025090460.1 uncharacterized protein LOC112561860 isoform X2 [Pomacea canaliculata]XP_025090461.1 uncharacterized protein LOC112561860 isoform X2 [Pomacea canaliculata]XP_025090462.1 uncharacterized protein LOC112561860 isoform X2 [Pomacea canaliculata]